MRIAFVIRSLERGGAERQLLLLAAGLQSRGHEVLVVTFYDRCDYTVEASGLPIVSVGKTGRWAILRLLRELYTTLRAFQPQLLHGYLPNGNVAVVLLRSLLRGCKLVWGIRASNMARENYDWFSRAVMRAESLLVSYPQLVLSNSQAGREQILSQGIDPRRVHVVPNGIDTSRFQFSETARRRLREELGLRDAVVFGMVARLDPMKGHEIAIRAMRVLEELGVSCKLICVGSGSKSQLDNLHSLCAELDQNGRITFLPGQADIQDVYSALDFFLLPSPYGEGFPNVLGEAMSCGIPCVVARVGDAPAIAGHCGEVTDATPEALADAMQRLMVRAQEEPGLRQACRARIVDNYSIARLVDSTERLLAECLAGGKERHP